MPSPEKPAYDAVRSEVIELIQGLGAPAPVHSYSTLRHDLRFSDDSLAILADEINDHFFSRGQGIALHQIADCQTIGDLVDLIWRLLRGK